MVKNSKWRKGKRAVSRGKLLSPESAASPSPSPRSSADPSRAQPPPGDQTPGSPQAPSPTSVPAAKKRSYTRRCVVLVDWWLQRVDDKICIAGLTETPQIQKEGYFSVRKNRSACNRVFNSAITKRCDSMTVETENGYAVSLKGFMNNSRMRENGFSEKVCESFNAGFPQEWKELLDSSMENIDEDSQSPSNSSDDDLEYSEKFDSDNFVRKGYFSSFRNLESSGLGEPGAPKTSVNLGTDNASKVPAAEMTPQSLVIQASDKNEVRTLRSGTILGRPINSPTIGGNKRKRTQHKASNNKKLSNEGVLPTADLTSNENGRSVAGIAAEDKLQSHDSHRKGQSDNLETEQMLESTRKPAKTKLSRRQYQKMLDSKRMYSRFL